MQEPSIQPLTSEEIQKACSLLYTNENQERVCRINEEISQRLELIGRFPKKVTVFGSLRFKEGHPDYERARHIAKRLAHPGIRSERTLSRTPLSERILVAWSRLDAYYSAPAPYIHCFNLVAHFRRSPRLRIS